MKGDAGWVRESLHTGNDWTQDLTYEFIRHWAGEYYKEQCGLSAVKEFLLGGGHLIYKNKINVVWNSIDGYRGHEELIYINTLMQLWIHEFERSRCVT